MRICSITPHHVVYNPRLHREADALSRAGHDVRVLSVRTVPTLSILDEKLAQGKMWHLKQINIERASTGYGRWFCTGVRYKLATLLWRIARKGGRLAGFSYTRTFSETIRQILSEPTDLIIAHTQPMLAPAYFAAKKIGCMWGFDCEDILSEEYGEGISDLRHQALVRFVEATFMPRAHYVTVASELYTGWLRDHHGISKTLVLRNVPSLAEAPAELSHGYPQARPYLSLHWFSQTIGPLRGIEDLIRVLPRIRAPVQLHLRGRVLPCFEKSLRSQIAESGARDRIFLHKPNAPDEVIRSAAQHDIGFVTNIPCCLNHQLAVPNKLYSCLMAGLAVGVVSTDGQRNAFSEMSGVGFLYEPGNVSQLADQINALAQNPNRLAGCRRRAFELARTCFNWESECSKIIDLVAGLNLRECLNAKRGGESNPSKSGLLF